MSSLKRRLKESTTNALYSMHKVPKQLRDINNKAYEPEVVSIGPYHFGKDELKEMEKVKVSYMKSLLKRRSDVDLNVYFLLILEVKDLAWDYYGEEMSRNPYKFDRDDCNDFIDMLILDGCFMLELIRESNGQGKATYIHSRLRNSLQRDLLLLENQIPFFVLCILYNIIDGTPNNLYSDTSRDMCGRFLMKQVLLFFNSILPGRVSYAKMQKRNPKEIRHILDLIHFNWYPLKSSESVSVPIPPTTSESDTIFTKSVSKLIDDAITSPLVIPSASKLKEANVKFIFSESWEAKEAKSKNNPFNNIIHLLCEIFKDNFRKLELLDDNMFDVKFEDTCGKLVLPRLIIDGRTKSLLRNLIAYEQMLPTEEHTPITDYALLLDSLINDATDVQILSKYGIIQNRLSSDEAVADFANQLTYKIIYCSDKFRYSGIFRRINSYYEKRKGVVRWNRAVAELREKYFNSPWSFIAIVAATVLLLLTVAQTVFAAKDHFKRP